MKMTTNMVSLLAQLVEQSFAAMTSPGAFSDGITVGRGAAHTTTVRALQARGLVDVAHASGVECVFINAAGRDALNAE